MYIQTQVFLFSSLFYPYLCNMGLLILCHSINIIYIMVLTYIYIIVLSYRILRRIVNMTQKFTSFSRERASICLFVHRVVVS